MKIVCVGLGTCKNKITLEAAEFLRSADNIVLKTSHIPSADFFHENGISFVSCDELFDQSEDFETLNKRICDFLLSFSEGTTAFCVRGSGTSDRTVQYILNNVKNSSLITGVSAAEVLLSKAPSSAVQIFTAAEFLSANIISFDIPLVIFELDDCLLAGDTVAKLTEFFDDETQVVLFNGGKFLALKLHEVLKQKKIGLDSALMISPQPICKAQSFDFGGLMQILRILRAPDGCPWDRVQTHESLRANVIEEAYELATAITNNDEENLIEELGDCLLQVFFHTEIAKEEGRFGYKEILSSLCKKLISRHTHIFGDDNAAGAEQAVTVWEQNKAKEKGTQSVAESMYETMESLPALLRAEKLQKKAAKVGFDWASADGAFEKIAEENAELRNEFLKGGNASIEEELGDLLFSVVNVSRFLNISPEVALNRANEKFVRRFAYIESELKAQGKTCKQSTLEEMDLLWKQAKQKEL